MVAQKITVVRKKTDYNVVRVRPRFNCIKDSANTMIEVSDLAIISGLHDFRQLWVNSVSPDGVSHVGDLLIQVIFLDASEDQLWNLIGIVHSIERNWRREGRMR